MLADIEREAAARREAIATLFGSSQPLSDDTGESASRTRGKRGSSEG